MNHHPGRPFDRTILWGVALGLLFSGGPEWAHASSGNSCSAAPEDVAAAAKYLIERDNERDLEGVLAGYTDDVIWLPPAGEAIVGKAAIEPRYRELFGSRQPKLKSEILEAHAEGGTGYIRGVTSGTLEPLNDGTAIEVNDKFLAIVRCDGGAWRVSHLAWSSRSPAGQQPRNLTRNPASDRRPAWSPDGSAIAFESDRDGNWEIYLTGSDGRNPTRVTNNPGADRRPYFSPDGAFLVFQSDRDGDNEIYVMNSDGTDVRRLTDNEVDDVFPAWSPDGAAIAFSSDRDGNLELYRMNSDGSGQTRLTNGFGRDLWPTWRREDSSIVFFSRGDDDQNDDDLFVIDKDGNGLRALTDHDANDFCPAWSGDGQRIAFASRRNSEVARILVLDLNTMQMGRLHDDPGRSTEPAWAPDGSAIAYVSNRDGNDEVYITQWPVD